MKKILVLVAVATLVAPAAMADDNKVVEGAKAVGKGLMWGPKKLALGMKKGFEAVGNGAKKLTGKS